MRMAATCLSLLQILPAVGSRGMDQLHSRIRMNSVWRGEKKMNLLSDPWIPVRADGGMGEFRLLTFEELLCVDGAWWVSIPRDDLEMACIQLLVCMVQVMLMPNDEDKREADKALLDRIRKPLSAKTFNEGVAKFRDNDWFNLD